eukprot:jgi/Bigna1/90477/estExt_fgenesh1_pg.C_710061
MVYEDGSIEGTGIQSTGTTVWERKLRGAWDLRSGKLSLTVLFSSNGNPLASYDYFGVACGRSTDSATGKLGSFQVRLARNGSAVRAPLTYTLQEGQSRVNPRKIKVVGKEGTRSIMDAPVQVEATPSLALQSTKRVAAVFTPPSPPLQCTEIRRLDAKQIQHGALRTVNQEMLAANAHLQRQWYEQDKKVKKLENDLETLSSRLRAETEARTEKEAKLSKCLTENEDLKRRNAKLISTNEDITTQLNGKTDRVRMLEGENANLRKNLKARADTQKETEERLVAANMRVDSLMQQLAEIDNFSQGGVHQHSQYQSELEEQLEALAVENNRLKEQLWHGQTLNSTE